MRPRESMHIGKWRTFRAQFARECTALGHRGAYVEARLRPGAVDVLKAQLEDLLATVQATRRHERVRAVQQEGPQPFVHLHDVVA